MAYATASGSTHASTTAPVSDDRGRQLPAMASAAPPKHLPTRARQFAAVLHKNYLLQTRSRRLWIGGAGWLALLIEVRSLRRTFLDPAVRHHLWESYNSYTHTGNMRIPSCCRFCDDPPLLIS